MIQNLVGVSTKEELKKSQVHDTQTTKKNTLLLKHEKTIKLTIKTIKTSGLNNNSLIPAYHETERFIKFLNDKFKLELPIHFIVIIQSRNGKKRRGWFSNCEWKNTHRDLNSINIASEYLNDNTYEIIAHELAHYVNFTKSIKDFSANQYHNKHFMSQVKVFGLNATYVKKEGYAFTETTPEFDNLVKEFKPNPEAFNVYQINKNTNKKQTTRNYLFQCQKKCFKIRCGNLELNINCNVCNSKFVRGG